MPVMRPMASLFVPAALGLCLALAGCGSSTPSPDDPSSADAEGKTNAQKAAESGPDAALLGEVRQLNSLLAAIDKTDSGRPKALDRLGEALLELSKNNRQRAIEIDPAAASIPAPPEPKAPDQEGDAPAPVARGPELPPHPADALKKLKPEAQKRIQVADKMAAEAVKAHRRLMNDHPDYPGMDKVLFRLGTLFVEYGQAAAARPVYFTLIEKYPKSPLAPEAYMSFAEFFFAEEDYDNSYKLFQKVVEYQPSERTSIAAYKLALSLHKLSRLDEAKKALEIAASSARIHGPATTVDDIYRDAPKLAASRKPLSAPDAAQFFVRLAEGREDVIKQELNRLAQILEDESRPLEAVEVLHVLSDRTPSEKCAITARSIEVATRSGNNAIRTDEVKRALRLGCKQP
jgi:tetratricopeptide (TPR) repeat protein